MLAVTREQMRAPRQHGSEQDRLVFRRQADACRKLYSRIRFVGDFEWLNEPVQPCSCSRLVEVPLRLRNGKGAADQDDIR